MTPQWTAQSDGQLKLAWGSPDDFLTYLNTVIAPAGLAYGYRITVEPVPKGAVSVDRA